MSAPEQHALLSASGAHKWMNCTPSARLEEQFPETQSTYADEGRLAHGIAELKMRKAFIEPMGPRSFNSKLKKLQEDPLYQEEMLGHTDAYIDYVSSIVHGYNSPPYIAAEKRLDYSAYVPEGFGTGDCIIIGDDTLYVIDFKYGKGVPVSAEDNPQMKLYALGALQAYSILFAITKVKMAIVQPRLDSISEYEMTADDLMYWATNVVMGTAEKAFKGEGEFVPGEHCRFCRAKARCRARSEFNISLEEFNKMKPPLISNDEVGQLLTRAVDLAKWAKDLEEYALAECLMGNDIPGWKAVEGRGKRAFINTDEAFNILKENGYKEEVLYTREPLSPAKVEELIGKKQYKQLLITYVSNPPGKPTLVKTSDKREAITRSSAEDDFKGGNENE